MRFVRGATGSVGAPAHGVQSPCTADDTNMRNARQRLTVSHRSQGRGRPCSQALRHLFVRNTKSSHSLWHQPITPELSNGALTWRSVAVVPKSKMAACQTGLKALHYFSLKRLRGKVTLRLRRTPDRR